LRKKQIYDVEKQKYEYILQSYSVNCNYSNLFDWLTQVDDVKTVPKMKFLKPLLEVSSDISRKVV